MIRALLLALILSAGCASAAHAGDEPPLQMNFFMGCWRGTFDGSTTVTDDRCFEPAQNGTLVRDTHEVRGAPQPYGGETIFYLDAEANRMALVYFSSDGGVSRGFAEPDGHGGLTFPPGTYVASHGGTLTMRGYWRAEGPNAYLAVSEIQEYGKWREHLRIHYVRAPDLTAPIRR